MSRLIVYQGFRIHSQPQIVKSNEVSYFSVSGHIFIDQACKAEFIYHLENIPPVDLIQKNVTDADDVFIKYARLFIDQRLGNSQENNESLY